MYLTVLRSLLVTMSQMLLTDAWQYPSNVKCEIKAPVVGFIGQYFSCTWSQGVAALVPISDDKIQITLLILGLGAFSSLVWCFGSILLQEVTLLIRCCECDWASIQRADEHYKDNLLGLLTFVLQTLLLDGVTEWIISKISEDLTGHR